MNTQIDNAIRRTQSYIFEDGLTEVFIGALTFLGSLVLLTAKQPFVAFGLFVVGIILITKILERLRERNTYRRSGYLSYKEHKSKRWVTLLLAMISCLVAAGFLMAAWILDTAHALAWPALIVGVFVGGVFSLQGDPASDRAHHAAGCTYHPVRNFIFSDWSWTRGARRLQWPSHFWFFLLCGGSGFPDFWWATVPKIFARKFYPGGGPR